MINEMIHDFFMQLKWSLACSWYVSYTNLLIIEIIRHYVTISLLLENFFPLVMKTPRKVNFQVCID
jgi:hypothetical protein